MSLSPPAKVQKLQAALHAKVKGSPDYRFYALYDKLYRRDVLSHAYACCKANRGKAGVDGQAFEDIESYGPDRWLGELAKELRTKTYVPQAVRRVYIPKANGGQQAYRAVDRHACRRLRRWLQRKHKVESRGTSHFPDPFLWAQGLAYLQGRPRSVPCTKA